MRVQKTQSYCVHHGIAVMAAFGTFQTSAKFVLLSLLGVKRTSRARFEMLANDPKPTWFFAFERRGNSISWIGVGRMGASKRSQMIARLCSAALLLLIAPKAASEDQPGGLYPQPSEEVVRKLLSVARKACRGTLDNNPGLLKALSLTGPTYFYRERPAPELALIPVRYCPEPSQNAEFMVGRFAKEKSFFYKTSALTARPVAAAQSFFDPARNDIVYEPIAVTRELQDNYNALIGFLMTKWGR